ncbi:hypothetical protein [Vagococcus fluvialis]|uniref:hypothetical protein n=1 Tax=Vagococcus fluvialis TaxID=2738 RepID=UPI001A8E301D|nr:hypothetical protein [Vagococcus fluvialis]MBO0438431.1 hypothetical protein [Vagococcus fluvialis]
MKKLFLISGIFILMIFALGMCVRSTTEKLNRENEITHSKSTEEEIVELTTEEQEFYDDVYNDINNILDIHREHKKVAEKKEVVSYSNEQYASFATLYVELMDILHGFSSDIINDFDYVNEQMITLEKLLKHMGEPNNINIKYVKTMHEYSLKKIENNNKEKIEDQEKKEEEDIRNLKSEINNEITAIGPRLEKALQENDAVKLDKLSKEMDVLEKRLKELYE